jgi:flagellar motor switch protein FliG
MDKIKKAAIILLGLGDAYAEEILKNMSKSEVHKIMEVINTLDSVSEDDVIQAMNEFFNVTEGTGIDIVSKEHLKNSIVSALGIKGMEKIDLEKSKWLDLIKNEPLDGILEMIRDEHPQVITALVVILTQLGSLRSSEITKAQTKERKSDIIRRMSTIAPMSTFGLEALGMFIEAELDSSERYGVVTVDGVDVVANLISNLDMETEREILTDLSSTDKALAEKIQDKLLPFEKLSQLDSKSLQILLKEISSEDLVLSLKGSHEHLRNTFMRNMSTKAAEILKDDLEAKGPVKLSNVIEAQKRIILLAKKLAKEEKIILTNKTDNDVVL